MKSTLPGGQSAPREACKLITCVLPNDGTHKELIRALRDEKRIYRANSISCLGVAILGDVVTKFGELPEPTLVRKVDVVVLQADAHTLYDYIYETARIGRPQGGAICMGVLNLTSPFSLPGDVPVEDA